MKGALIVIAGIDGSGKSTISRELVSYYRSKEIENVYHEKFINENKFDKESLYETVKYISSKKRGYSNAEFEHIRSCFYLKKRIMEIYNRIEKGEIIILERFVETIFGHQYLYNFDKTIALDIFDFNALKVSYYFMLKVEPELAYKRILQRDDCVHFHEQLNNLNLLDSIYTKYSNDHEGYIVNGTLNKTDIVSKIYKEIEIV